MGSTITLFPGSKQNIMRFDLDEPDRNPKLRAQAEELIFLAHNVAGLQAARRSR